MNGDDIDWARLLNPYRGQSISSSKDAQDVLVAALGPDAIAAGVDHYLDNWMNDTEVLRYVFKICLLYTSPSPRDKRQSRMPSSA